MFDTAEAMLEAFGRQQARVAEEAAKALDGGRTGAPIDFDVVTEMIFASDAEYAQMQKERAAVAQWIADDVARFADPGKTRSYVADVCVSG